MNIEINNKIYPIIIIHKNNKNTYIRITDNLEISVTTSPLMSKIRVKKIVENNIDSVQKMIEKKQKEIEDYKHFHYLNKIYDIIYYDTPKVFFIDDKIYTKNDKVVQKGSFNAF